MGERKSSASGFPTTSHVQIGFGFPEGRMISHCPRGGTPDWNRQTLFDTGFVERRPTGACGAICPLPRKILATLGDPPFTSENIRDVRRSAFLRHSGHALELIVVVEIYY